MLLSVFTRHSTSCRFSRDRACRRCNCPKWVSGQVNGYYFRQSAKTRQWAEAEEVCVKLEEALIKGLPPFGAAVATGSVPRQFPLRPILLRRRHGRKSLSHAYPNRGQGSRWRKRWKHTWPMP